MATFDGEGSEKDVIYCIPAKWTGNIALRDSTFGGEQDVLDPKGLETGQASLARLVMGVL